MASVDSRALALQGRHTDVDAKLEGADPFTTAPCGGSPRTATAPASPSTGATTRRGSLGEPPVSSSAPARPSSCEPGQQTLFSSGATSSTTVAKMASAARSSATRGRAYRPSLSDRLTRSLITSGLVCGITPSSIRQLSGQPIRVLAFDTLAGGDAASHGEG